MVLNPYGKEILKTSCGVPEEDNIYIIQVYSGKIATHET
jgi:hypothetical protein